ncbi:MAG TPA: hypothetical protein DCM73_04430 [Clostridiales bacterium]|nr:hypothetical protein [Clostridiales bacterium]
MAIEYQGIQHYEAIAHWGGKKALERQIERDIIKREFCQEKGVSLIEVKYTEKLEINYIKAKLKKFM